MMRRLTATILVIVALAAPAANAKNALAAEKSRYLRDHADNLVQWHAWSAETLAMARKAKAAVVVAKLDRLSRDVAFISDETLDQLPLPSRVGKVRVGGVDLNNPRMRAALSAVLALGPSPMGFGVAGWVAATGQRLVAD